MVGFSSSPKHLAGDKAIEEYHNLLNGMYDKLSTSKSTDRHRSFNGELTGADLEAKEQFTEKNKISQLTQALAEYLIFVQRFLDGKPPPVPQTVIYTAILRLEKTLAKRASSTWELVDNEKGKDEDGSQPNTNFTSLSDFELNLLEQTLCQYISYILDDGETDILFFPPTKKPSPNVIVTWRIVEKIAQVKVIQERTLYMHKLEELAKIRLKREVQKWLDEDLKKLKFETREDWMPNSKQFLKTLQAIDEKITKAADESCMVSALFTSLRFSYWDLVGETIEEKLLPICEKAVKVLDSYQKAYKDFHVNMRDSCILGHALYLRIKHVGQRLVTLAKSQRKSACVKLQNIEPLFGNCFLNLLHVMEGECHQRIRRAVESEQKDSFIEEECIMSSTVIVLNCLCTVVDEWSKLEIDADDMGMAFMIKVTDIICDGAKIFANEMENRAFSSGSASKDSEYIKKVCFLLNSAEHMQEHVSKLPDMMKWEELLRTSVLDPAVADYKNQIRRVLKLLLEATRAHFQSSINSMISLLSDRIRCQHSRFLNSWFQIHGIHLPGSQNMEKFLASLHETLGIVNDNMKETLFPTFLGKLRLSFLDFTEENFQEGKSAEYAKTIKKNINDLRRYFTELNVEESAEDVSLFQRILDMLDLNSRSTVELQLQYFSYFADLVTSPDEYLGHIAIQAGYKKRGRGVVDIHLKIKKLQRLPVSKFNIDQVHVKLQLAPRVIFPSFRAIKTRTLTDVQESPVFDESFHFKDLPVSVLSVEGSVIQALVSNQDSSFCCEALLKMNRIQDMCGFSSVEFLPVYLLPLRRMDKQHTIFKILEQRKKKDRQAKRFITRRKRTMSTRTQLLSCFGVTKPIQSFPTSLVSRMQWFRQV